MARYVSRVLTGARQAATPSRLAKFGREFVEGALEDELKEQMYGDRDFQTGPPTAGGSCASMLRGFFKSRSPAAPDPHTNREEVAHLQAQGITKPQAVAMLANRSELLDSRTLHAMTHFLDLKSMDVGAMQRTAHLTESPAALEALLQITGQIVDMPTSAPFLQDRRVSDHY